MLTLVGETAALALDLLEKNGVLIPFCKVRSTEFGSCYIQAGDFENSPESEYEPEKCAESARAELKRRISAGTILEFAFCSDRFFKIQNEPVERRFLSIEFQNGTNASGIYLFPLAIENGKASVGSYLVSDLQEKLL
jgi:hypothetical protein